MIPVIVISFNNWKYVRNMVDQLRRFDALTDIRILDNCSTDPETRAYIETAPVTVIRNTTNAGPWISPTNNAELYASLPDLFVLTDPDLQLNPNLQPDFLQSMIDVARRHNASKVGFALDISTPELFLDGPYVDHWTIAQHEHQFWREPIQDPHLELYRAPIDTTFCVINKQFVDHGSRHIRIAGDFTAQHIPWYIHNPVISLYENYMKASVATSISTMSRVIVREIERSHLCIRKQEQTIAIERRPDDTNLDFWASKFGTWEPETFNVFDRILDPTKVFIDIGGWIGTTCIYASRKSARVIVVEADPVSFQDLTRNCALNDCTNVTAVHAALFNETGRTISIVGNNESVSQISLNGGGYPVTTTSIHALLLDHHVDPATISLIKVDIEGAEEMVLHDLYALHIRHSIPIYLSFHYPFFKDANLDRFTFLTDEQKHVIRTIPFPSILFVPNVTL